MNNYRVTMSRSGFTQLELLLTISTLTVLMAMLLPAVQHARETARSADCTNRLRQLGVALHSFVSSSAGGELPTGYNDAVPVKWPGKKVSPQVQLLPYLDCSSQYSLIMESGVLRYTDEKLQFRLSAFHCPSDVTTMGLNFRGSTGAVPNVFADPADGAGAFSSKTLNHGVRLGDVQDGLSNTAAMCERIVADSEYNRFSPKEDIWFSSAAEIDASVVLNSEAASLVCASLTSDPGHNYAATSGHSFIAGGLVNIYYNHIVGPNSMAVDCSMDSCCESPPSIMSTVPISTSVAVVTARSFHPAGVVNLLLLDGAVIKAPKTISLSVWQDYGTRADISE
jgi:type II secretory pathway pseudopilin PulG